MQIVFNHPFVQPFRITSLVRSNQSVTLMWESVPGQSYTVESTVTLGATNAWTALAGNLLATNYSTTLRTNLSFEAAFFRIKNND